MSPSDSAAGGGPPLDALAERFEANRSHLRAVAYRMLGSLSEADDAVQEAWFRLSRTEPDTIDNLGGWLTTVIARVCLDLLRRRRSRREDRLDAHVPDPIVSAEPVAGTAVAGAAAPPDPEDDSLLADAVSLALLVVLDALPPAERLAFVLHDMFAVPFDEIAVIVDRSPAAARQMASRARRRVQGATPVPEPDLARQRQVVDAFFAAARHGDFEALVAVLDPDVVLRSDGGTARPELTMVLQGASEVAGRALTYSRMSPFVRPALVNGGAGVVVMPRPGHLFSIMAFTVQGGRIVQIDSLVDPDRLRSVDLSALGALDSDAGA
jgi:RNA polymerase sigma-70 factor (ECF subfamily)